MNWYDRVAESQITSPTKAKMRAAAKRAEKAPMKPTAQEQAQIDGGRQMRQYRKWKRAQMRDFRERHPDAFSMLRRTLRNLEALGPEGLVAWVQGAQWLKALSHADRLLVVGAIGKAIARLRVRTGADPYDDSMIDEPPTAFELIRTELDCFSTPKENS